MKRTICTCDHCGKELDEMKDYVDYELDTLFHVTKTDLCNECAENLDTMIKNYIKLAVK